MLVLAAITALAATAIAGAASASATVLCKTNTTPCSEKYSAGIQIKADSASGTTVKLVNAEGGAVNSCSSGALTSPTENVGGATETVRSALSTSGLTWSSCAWPMTTVKAGEFEIHWISGGVNGTLTLKGLEITMDTGAPFGTCSYTSLKAGSHAGTITGGLTPTLDVFAFLEKTSGICPSGVRWQGTYTVTSPTPLYVRDS
jgi:hypothetical protein